MTKSDQPTIEQLNAAKTWTDLCIALEVSPRNSSALIKLKNFVRDTFPDHYLLSRKRSGKFTDEEFIELVNNHTSMRALLIDGGYRVTGSSYTFIKDRCKKLNVSMDHFLGQSNSRGKPTKNKKPIEEYFVVGSTISSSSLRKRLIAEGIKDARCETCATEEWCGKPAPLQLDHINGNKHDNRLINLRILCANCHAQTETHSGKNVAFRIPPCQYCGGKKKTSKNITCGNKKCLDSYYHAKYNGLTPKRVSKKQRPTKITWPSNDELSRLVWEYPLIILSKKLGVTDNAIRKRCKKNGIVLPIIGHWQRIRNGADDR